MLTWYSSWAVRVLLQSATSWLVEGTALTTSETHRKYKLKLSPKVEMHLYSFLKLELC